MTSIEYADWVHKGTEVIAKYGVGNGTRGLGRVLAYCEAPQVLIQPEDGEPFWWRADQCDEVAR
jgi:hypothetical protein